MLWGTTGTAASMAPDGASAVAIGAGTMGFGGALLTALSLRGVRALWGHRAMRRTALLGGAAVAVYPLAFYSGMATLGVGIGTMIAIGSAPLFALMLERVLDRRRPTSCALLATSVAIVGGALVALGARAGDVASDAVVPGLLLALLAGLTYAAYAYAAGRLIAQGAGAHSAMGLLFGIGALALLPVFAVTGGSLVNDRGVAVLAYLAVVPMALAYVLFGRGLRHAAASTATTISLAEPVVAALLAVVVVGERPRPLAWAGMALVAGGLVLLAGQAVPPSGGAANASRHAASAAYAGRIDA